MSRATEYLEMINTKSMPSDNDFLMLCPSLGLSDKKIIKEMRKDSRMAKNKAQKQGFKEVG